MKNSNKLKVIIDRLKWNRGNGSGSFLFDPRTNMLTINGFVGLALEYTTEEMQRKYTCNGMFYGTELEDRWPQWMTSNSWKTGIATLEDANDSGKIYLLNDAEHISDEEREQILTELYEYHDIILEFIN